MRQKREGSAQKERRETVISGVIHNHLLPSHDALSLLEMSDQVEDQQVLAKFSAKEKSKAKKKKLSPHNVFSPFQIRRR